MWASVVDDTSSITFPIHPPLLLPAAIRAYHARAMREGGWHGAELVQGARYGLSLTTTQGVLDGVRREVLVFMGGFAQGGEPRHMRMRAEACETLAAPPIASPRSWFGKPPPESRAKIGSSENWQWRGAGYTGEMSTFAVLAWDPPAPGERWPTLFWNDPAPRAPDGTHLGTQPLPCAYHRCVCPHPFNPRSPNPFCTTFYKNTHQCLSLPPSAA